MTNELTQVIAERDALRQQLEAVLAENAALKYAITAAHESAEECEFNGELCYVVPSSELESLGDILDDAPASDRLLAERDAEMMARGVLAAADFFATANNGHEIHPDIEELRDFAAQLRAGASSAEGQADA